MASGDYNVICDASGFKVKASETRMQWNGLRVHRRFWEPEPSLDHIVTRTDNQSVRNARPEYPDVFVEYPDSSAVSLESQNGAILISQTGEVLQSQQGGLL